jgi:high-affinity nickel-transport protein
LKGGVFDAIARLDFGFMGVIIVAAFVITWVGAYAIFKIRRVEERWGRMVRS